MADNVLWSTIFLGNLPEIDTDESSTGGENLGPLLTTFGSAAEPLYDQVVDMSTDSADGTMTSDNASSGDTITYDVGGGPQTSEIDAGLYANVTLTYLDGSSVTQTVAIIQDQLGNTFLLAFDGQTALGDQAIESLTVNNVSSSGASYSQTGFDSVKFVCFASGTRIACPGGARAVEEIAPGDIVETLDHGARPVRLAVRRRLDFATACERHRPVRITAGAFGPGRLPRRDLTVSPQHRMLLRGADVFVIARALTGLRGIRVDQRCRHVTYHGLLMDRHEVLIAEGVPAESLYPGPVAMSYLAPRDRARVLGLFPRLLVDPINGYGPTARATLRQQPARYAIREECGAV